MPSNYRLFIRLIVFIICLQTYKGHAQSIKVEAQNEQLGQVLQKLHEQYDIPFSGSDELLSACTIDLTANYPSPKAAVAALVASCALDYKMVAGVFIIVEKAPEVVVKTIKKRTPRYIFKGQIIDEQTQEPLPFSNLQVQGKPLVSDANGSFTYQCRDSMVEVWVSHLGYFQYQTTLTAKEEHTIVLKASITQLKEVVVEAKESIKSIHLSEKNALIKLNHQVASFLPGAGNNSLAALLRLQAGIQAAGEQTRDYFIWGAYKGQSHLLFDGITIFNASGFNDEIGAINPTIIQDIEVFKGGYNVHIGDRVGGVVNITSKNGSVNDFQTQFHLSNQVINAYTNVPIVKKASLQVALRSTIPDLFDPKTYQQNTYPDYHFSDFNLKFSMPFQNGDQFKISVLGNVDFFENRFSEYNADKFYSEQTQRWQYQGGANINYRKAWKKWGTTIASSSYSMLYSTFCNQRHYEDFLSSKNAVFTNDLMQNSISEFSTLLEHHLPATPHHQLSFGLGYVYNAFFLQREQNGSKRAINESSRLRFHVKDNITLAPFLSIQPGLRLDVLLNGAPLALLQPRIDAVLKPHENWKINLAYGIYNQFIVENPIVDYLGNYYYHWRVNNAPNPDYILKSMHYVGGFSCSYHHFSCQVDGYYKTTDNMEQFYRDTLSKKLLSVRGNGRSYGVDIQLKGMFKRQQLWVAYSWAKTEDRFEGINNFNYQRAPHDQRHEVKLAGLFNFSPFFVSVNYVYGSGFPNTNRLQSEESIRPYSRLDAAFLYKIRTKKLLIETGVSFLNILNTQNIRYNNFSHFPDETIKYISGVGFTPTLFVNLSF